MGRRIQVILLALLLALGATGTAEAKRKEERKQYTLTEAMAKKLTVALEALQEERYAEVETTLAALEAKADRLNPYERALIYQMYGYLAAGRDQYKTALTYFEKCLAEDALPMGSQIQARFQVAQLYLATEQYAKAVSTLKTWFAEAEKPTGDAYYLLAVSYYQLGEFKKALEPAETAASMVETPKEAWLQLLVGLYWETKQFEKAVNPLERLITINPRKSYWTQLSSLYAHVDKEERSLAIMQLAYDQGFLEKDRELRALAQLYLYHALPYQAAVTIERGLSEGILEDDVLIWEMLANSWLLSREYDKALDPMGKAAELSDEGNLYTRLGQVFLDRERWSEAASAFGKAIEKGGLDDPGATNLMLGIAYYHQKKFDSARKHFGVAHARDSSRESAEQWLQLIDRESKAASES